MNDLTPILQKYLIAIYDVVLTNSETNVKDISEKMSMEMALTSEAVKNLAKKGYINYKPYSFITLTVKGKNTVDIINARHNIVSDFLEKVLMIDKKDLELCTNNLEFYVPEKVLMQLVSYINFINKFSCSQSNWEKSQEDYVTNGQMSEGCAACAQNCGHTCHCSHCGE